ncbi:hypothetical protein [Sorangium sp. So ce1151]|uniref:hypothetical protein n=1 Tax=Sorangium sp. So ce1151 TaxID=3133332 RepID=UPI003F5F1453
MRSNYGALDGQEPNPVDDTDGDGLFDVRDVDSDDDGLFDGTELGRVCADAATDADAGTCIPTSDRRRHGGSRRGEAS